MNRFRSWPLILVLSVSGCISIGTHEKAMKKCRDTAEQLSQTQSQVSSLQSKNVDLEKALAEKSEEHEVLRTEMTNVRSTYDELLQELKENIANGDVGVQETDKGLTITMGNQILFASGQSELQPKGKKVLMRVSGVIKKTSGRLIQVEGHTDNMRIAGPLKTRFPSNWDLSAARAASVVRFLEQSGGIDPARLVLTAFGEHRPLGDNATLEGRQQNRRVEITLIPETK